MKNKVNLSVWNEIYFAA